MRMRTFHHFWVMLVAGCVDADPLSRGGTDAGLLITDAGLLIADAGTFQDAGEDLQRPAGPPDAGVFDQGCVFGDNPQFIFTCEGDEDFCDEEHDTPLPATDMVALWSHVVGADFVVDIRLGAMPFRSATTSVFTFALGSSTENSVYSNYANSGLCGWSIPVKLTVDYGDGIPPLYTYPPTWFWPQPIDLAVQYSQCDFFEMSRSQPLLRLRVPIGLLALSDTAQVMTTDA